jgi:hypothetical protein
VTFRLCPASTLLDAGVTVTVGAINTACVIVTVVVPLAVA